MTDRTPRRQRGKAVAITSTRATTRKLRLGGRSTNTVASPRDNSKVRRRFFSIMGPRMKPAATAQALPARMEPAVLVAHSLAVALVNHLSTAWPALYPGRPLSVRGALRVGLSDVEAADYPPGPTGLDPLPLKPLPFPTIVVASTDDPRVTLERARFFANAWGARLEVAGALDHVGSDAKLGNWPQARAWLDELLG